MVLTVDNWTFSQQQNAMKRLKWQKLKEQSCNKINLLILHFYFTSLRSGENVIFLHGVTRAVVESVEFQEKLILYIHLIPGLIECYRNHFWARSYLTTFLAPGQRKKNRARERERERYEAKCNHELPTLTFPLKCRPWRVNTTFVGTSIILFIRCEVCCCCQKHLLFSIQCLVINRYLLEVPFCFSCISNEENMFRFSLKFKKKIIF